MMRYLLAFFLSLAITTSAYGQGKLTDLTPLTSPADEDLLYIVDDPSGSPVSKAITIQDLKTGIAVAGRPFKGALVSMTANQSINDSAETALTFDEEIYDTSIFHDNSTNNTRLTVPVGVAKVRISVGVRWASNSTGIRLIKIFKNGSSFSGTAINRYLPDNTSHTALATGVLEVITGDYFEVHVTQTSGGALNIEDSGDQTWFSIEAIETTAPSTTTRGALVHKAADQTTADYTSATAIAFDSESYDTDTIHDNSTNNSRLTVPTGVTQVRIHIGLSATSVTADMYGMIQIGKNGSYDYIGIPQQTIESGRTEIRQTLTSPILVVTSGDYFEMRLLIETDTSVTIDDDNTWFAMEIVEPVLVARETSKGALVHMAADETTANYSAGVVIPFDAESYDTNTIHDNSTNNSRLTVPSGVTKIQLTGGVRISALTASDWVNIVIMKNGTPDWIGSVEHWTEVNNTASAVNFSSAVLTVVGGTDYFEVRLKTPDTSITLDDDRTWFAMETIE